MERGPKTFDVDHRLRHHINLDHTIPPETTPLTSSQPNFDTYTDTYPDDDLEDDFDPSIFTKDTHTNPIYVFPDEEHFTGNNHSAILLKWHKITNHLSAKTLRRVAPHVRGMEEILQIPTSVKLPKCDACALALTKRKPLPKSTFLRADKPGIRLHCDSSGLIATQSIEGGRYYTLMIDCCSNFKFVDILKTKDAWLEALDRLHVRLGYIYKIVRTDNAGECCSERALHYYHVYRIWHEKAPAGPRQHHLNPRAENAIGLVTARTRVCLIQSGLHVCFWSFAVVYTVDVLNMCLPYKYGTGITCFEKQFGKKPDVSVLQPFGCRAYVIIDKKSTNFSMVTVPGIFLGLAWRYGKKGYCVITDDYKRLFISTDVTFRPACFPAKQKKFQLMQQSLQQTSEDDNDLMQHLTSVKDLEVVIQNDPSTDIPQMPESAIKSMRDSASVRPMYIPDIRPTETASTDQIMSEQSTADTTETEMTDTSSVEGESNSGSSHFNPETSNFAPEIQQRQQHKRKRKPHTRSESSATRSGKIYAMHTTQSPQKSTAESFSMYAHQASNFLNVSEAAGRYLATCFMAFLDEPKDFFDACSRRDADEWIEATYKELQTFIDLDAWEPVDRPPDAHVLGTKIVYKLKLNEKNEPVQHKARIVVQGYEMIEGLEFFHAFSAMAHPVTIRLLIAAAVANDWNLFHIDIKAAYLNAQLKERVLVNMPKGFERPDGKVMSLKRSVYGLKSAGNYWWKDFMNALKEFGLLPVTDDNCLMTMRRGESFLAIATVVDDCIIAGNDSKLRDELLSFLESKYTVSRLGNINWFLGVHYRRLTDNSLLATQSAYVDKCLERFKMTDIKPSKIPMNADFKVYESDLDKSPPKELIDEYRQKIGALIWLQLWTRPDIAYATNLLARYTLYCTPKLLAAVNRIWRYLKFTKELGIRFTRNDRSGYGLNTLVAYSDASDADCLMTRRSTGGHALFFNSGPTSWRSKRHNLTGLSSMDSETVEICATTQQIKHVQQICTGLGFPQHTTPVHVDNQSSIKTAENPCMQHHTKHMGRRYSFVREAVEDKSILLVYTPSKVNIADIFTKPLPYAHFVYLRTLLLNCRPSDVSSDTPNKMEHH